MAVDYATLKKGGFMRQKQKNNFSLRLRVVGGNLTAKQLAAIAEVSDKYGEGYVHLTSRQSVEIPFIKLNDIDEVKAALAKGDAEPGVCGPRVRTITACQGAAVCPSGCIDTYALAKELDESKCNFCGRCFKACPTEAWDTIHGYIVSFGGLFGNHINKGETVIPFIEDKETLMKICDTAIQFFDDNAKAGERFKFTIDRVGREKFTNTILEVYNNG